LNLSQYAEALRKISQSHRAIRQICDDWENAFFAKENSSSGQRSAMSPKKVDMLLGSADRVTPFLGGIALAKRWKVPDTNLFICKQGHFCGALGLSHDAAPLQRFADLLLQT